MWLRSPFKRNSGIVQLSQEWFSRWENYWIRYLRLLMLNGTNRNSCLPRETLAIPTCPSAADAPLWELYIYSKLIVIRQEFCLAIYTVPIKHFITPRIGSLGKCSNTINHFTVCNFITLTFGLYRTKTKRGLLHWRSHEKRLGLSCQLLKLTSSSPWRRPEYPDLGKTNLLHTLESENPTLS